MKLARLFKKNRFFWLVAVMGLVVDQLTKLAVSRYFSELGETVPLWEDVFHFTYVVNTGAAFSLFEDQLTWLRWLSFAVTIGLILFGVWSPRLPKLEQYGYGFVLAGAAGNGIDRFLLGFVIDFLDFRFIQFPVFNIADICINIGVICLIIVNLTDFQRSRRPKNGEQNYHE